MESGVDAAHQKNLAALTPHTKKIYKKKALLDESNRAKESLGSYLLSHALVRSTIGHEGLDF